MQIRKADVGDARLLAEMNQQLIQDEGHRNRMSVDALERRMADWLAGEYEAFLISIDGSTVGYALSCACDEHVYIRQYFIKPDHRRQGVGRLALQWLRANVWGDARLRLDVLTNNQAAQVFWHSLGFRDYCVTMELESPLR